MVSRSAEKFPSLHCTISSVQMFSSPIISSPEKLDALLNIPEIKKRTIFALIVCHIRIGYCDVAKENPLVSRGKVL